VTSSAEVADRLIDLDALEVHMRAQDRPSDETGSRRAALHRLVRYGSVSAISTATSLVILGVLHGVVGMTSVLANVFATVIGTIPSFELNRRWVWSGGGQPIRLAQVIPFCALSLSGLVLSTLVVHVDSDHTINWTRLKHTTAVELANVGTFGVLWVA
jgi:putative flippase GtrA